MSGGSMEGSAFVDELVMEYLLFRGFTRSVQTFEEEAKQDKMRGFRATKIVDTLFQRIQAFDIEGLNALWGYMNTRFFSQVDASLASTAWKLRNSLYRLYVVTALKQDQRDHVTHFFRVLGPALKGDAEWDPWFAIPFLPQPEKEASFGTYFSEEWAVALTTSLTNFIDMVFATIARPRLLNFEAAASERHKLLRDLSTAQDSLANVQADNARLRLQIDKLSQELRERGRSSQPLEDQPQKQHSQSLQDDSRHGSDPPSQPMPSASVVHQKIISGHSGPVTQCKFSNQGFDFATGASDSTVRIWSTHGQSGVSTIHFESAEVSALTWEKNDRYLLYGLTNQQVKVWDVEDKKVVTMMMADQNYPLITELQCSPVGPQCITAASSVNGAKGKLLSWNWQVGKIERRFEIDPVASICSVALNHNGNIMVAGGSDGLVRMYDMIKQSCVHGWQAHDCPVVSVHFADNETSIISFGANGKMVERGLHTYAVIEHDFEFASLAGGGRWLPNVRFESAMDRFVSNTPNNHSNIYSARSRSWLCAVPGHDGAVLNCDWHPAANCVLTTGADHNVVLTTIKAL